MKDKKLRKTLYGRVVGIMPRDDQKYFIYKYGRFQEKEIKIPADQGIIDVILERLDKLEG